MGSMGNVENTVNRQHMGKWGDWKKTRGDRQEGPRVGGNRGTPSRMVSPPIAFYCLIYHKTHSNIIVIYQYVSQWVPTLGVVCVALWIVMWARGERGCHWEDNTYYPFPFSRFDA
jgi:hypothetical protein